MPDLGGLVTRWGYVAIVLLVLLGNAGLPIPEDAVLALAGYLAWTGRLRLPLVLAIGVLSAVAGDNLGYWVGRRYGRAAIERYHPWVGVTPRRLEAARRLVARYGALGVFVARFVPGLRFMAGPLAGAGGLPVRPFLVANLLGALTYVPLAVTAGYAVAYGLGAYVVVLVVAAISAVSIVSRQTLRVLRDGADS